MSCSSKRNNEVGSCISTLVSSTNRRGRKALPPGSSDVARIRPERDLACVSGGTAFSAAEPTPLPPTLLRPRLGFTGADATPAGSLSNAARAPDRPAVVDEFGAVEGLSFESADLERTGSSRSG